MIKHLSSPFSPLRFSSVSPHFSWASRRDAAEGDGCPACPQPCQPPCPSGFSTATSGPSGDNRHLAPSRPPPLLRHTAPPVTTEERRRHVLWGSCVMDMAMLGKEGSMPQTLSAPRAEDEGDSALPLWLGDCFRMPKADIPFSGVSFGGNLKWNMKKKNQNKKENKRELAVRWGISPKDNLSSFANLITSSHKFSLVGWNDLSPPWEHAG